MQTLIIILVWFAGFILAYLMQRTEIASEKTPYTFGVRLMIIAFSFLSFFRVLQILIVAWVDQIRNTGYWNEPVKKEQDIIVVAEKPKEKTRNADRVNINDN